MKTTRIFILRCSLFVVATLFFLGNTFLAVSTANAQSADAQAASGAASPLIIKPVARITQKIDEQNLVTLRGTVHPLARAAFDQGLVSDSRPMNHMLLILQRSPDQEAALRNLMDEQQIKGGANYHAWLTPQQFAQQFGVAGSDIQQVAGWLAGKGFTQVNVSNGGMFIEFSGTAGLVRNAFHTEIHNVMVNGQLHIANLTDAQIPAALAPVIARIHSLHDFRQKSYSHLVNAMEKLKAQGSLKKPGFGTGTGIFAVGPGDLATIYNIPSTVAGSPAGQGQTVAIVARSNITISDITQFGAAFNLPSLANFSTNNIIVNGPDPGIVLGDDEEATLDVDMVGSTAPNANILLVVNGGTLSGNLAGLTDPTDGVDQSALYIVDNNVAPVMTQSFGACELLTDDPFSDTLWEQAAAQGISVFVSTGDSGSDSCDDGQVVADDVNGLGTTVNVNGAASTPFDIAVGGTDFNDASNPTQFWNDTAALATAKSYIPEIPWNDSCAATATPTSLTTCANVTPDSTGLDLAGGSGGQSICGIIDFSNSTCTSGYPKPSWQKGVGVPADSVRDIPDVSLFASVNSPSNHFYVFCLADSGSQNPGPCNLTGPNFNLSGVGGTSASTPAWAGIMALVNQSEVAAGRSGRQGVANYVLYPLAAAQATSPGTSACNSTGTTAPAAGCTFNDITIGNNSVECVAGVASCSNQTSSGFGVLLEPTGAGEPFAANTPAWSATAGYDLATGLGTPNVSNLIANWGSVTGNLKAATPAITTTTPANLTNSTGVTHGSTATFTISVTSASGTPTGDVSLIAEPPGFSQVGVGFGTLSGGTVTITTNMLPGDNNNQTAGNNGAGAPYSVVAHYAGDGTFGPADSQPINVTVNREGSMTTITLDNEDIVTGALTAATSVQYGTNYIMVADVVGATAGTICNNSSAFNASVPSTITQIPTVPCPTGTITLKDNGVALNDFIQTSANNTNVSTVGNLGFVEDMLVSFLGGSHNVMASYSGDNSYNASSSTNGAFTVTKAPTQTGVTLNINGVSSTTAAAGQTVSLIATVATGYSQTCNNGTQTCNGASNGVGPTGTITFSSCGTASSCTVPLVPTAFNSVNLGAFATATLTTSFNSTPGAITAAYNLGDSNYLSCTAPTTTPAPGCSLTPLALTVSGTVGAASKLAFVTQPSTVPVGLTMNPPVQVAVEDINGNIISAATNSVTIAIGTNPGSGTLGGTVTATPVNGIATFSNLTLSAAGTGYTLTASATSLTGATSIAFNVILPPAKLAFIVPPSNVNAGSPILPAVQVAVEDMNGNIVSGATNSITVAIGTNPGGGTLSGPATTVAASGGIAVFQNLSISAAGTGYTLTASTTGLTSATSLAFNVLATASKLAFITQPSTTAAGKSIAPAVQVAVEDTNGNIIGGATTPITIAIGMNPGSATLAGTATVNAVNGTATFGNLNISAAGTGYTLTAAATGLTGSTSGTFNVTGPPSFTLSAPTTATTLSSSSGASASTTITVTPSNGFTGNVSVAASALPPGVTCPNSPVTIDVTGATAVTGTLTCQVTAHSTSMTAFNFLTNRDDRMLDAKLMPPASAPNSEDGQDKGWWALSAGTGFAALLLIFVPGGRKRLHAALGLSLICLLTLTLGCGGGPSGGGGGGAVNTTTSMTVNADTSATGMFTFTVTVTGGTPTGMVQLFDGTTMIGTAAAVSGGTATPTAPALSVGTHAISAHYLGTTTTLASQSGTLNLTSTGSASFTITGTSGNVSANTTVNVTVQ